MPEYIRKEKTKMDILTILAITIPSTLSTITALIHAYVTLKKATEPPKDEIWETATKLVCNSTEKNMVCILVLTIMLSISNLLSECSN